VENAGNTARELFEPALVRLARIYDEREAKTLCFRIAEHFLGWNRADMALRRNDALEPSKAREIRDALQALCDGKPLQYVLGIAHFCGLPLTVSPGVLIPRPETEELVMQVVETLSHSGANHPRILDIGTGSGAIAIALKKHLPGARIEACDISEQALDVARENAKQNGCADIRFFRADILDPAWNLASGPYQAIVSNPPYIPAKEKENMPLNVVRFEPGLALFVPDDDPLVYYRAILRFAVSNLEKSGFLAVEIHEGFGREIEHLFLESGIANVRVKRDIRGCDRMVTGEAGA
jgi:release factor glutamine methyltransferase